MFMPVDTFAGTTVWRLRVANVLGGNCERNELLQIHSYSSYFRFMSVDTVAGTTVWRLRVDNVWLVSASGMCYCSNILPVATLGLCPLTHLLAQMCGVREWPIFWVVTASGMSYCRNILTVATLGLCPLTQLLAQQCGV